MGVSPRCNAAGIGDQRRSRKPQVRRGPPVSSRPSLAKVAAEPESAAIQDVGTDRIVTFNGFRWRRHNRIVFAIAVAGPVGKKHQFSLPLAMINRHRPRDA
jgi:hypothetical protein